MADRNTTIPVEGETRVGSTTPGVQGVVHIASPVTSKGAVLALDGVSSAGAITTVYLWVSTDGKLRTGTTLPTDTEAGDVVGAQIT